MTRVPIEAILKTLALGALLAVAGCGGGGSAPAPGVTLQSVEVTPATASIAKGRKQAYSAIAHYSDGTAPDVTATATFAATPVTGAATISGNEATGTGVGDVTITATYGGQTGTATLTVTAAALESVTVSPAAPTVAKGRTQEFTATAHYSDGTAPDVTAGATWTSTANATMSGSVATGAAEGSATIAATYGGQTGTATLTVTAAALESIEVGAARSTVAKGSTLQLTATGHYSDATTRNLTTVAAWTSSAAAVTVSATGLATGATVGPATVRATSGAVQGELALTVTAPLLQSVTLSPSGASVLKGQTQQYVATGHYSDATTQDLTESATWSASAGTVVVSNATGTRGLALATDVGPVTITATVGGCVGTAQLDVTAAAISGIAITPAGSSIAKGLAQQLSATATYTDTTSKDVTSLVQWSSSSPAVSVSATGLARGEAIGTATIGAALGGVAGTTTVSVTSPVLQAVTVDAPAASMAPGGTQQLAAIGHYSDGSTRIEAAVWASDGAAATVDLAGLVTAVQVGSVSITATSGGFSGTATIAVTATPLVSIVVTPDQASIAKGLTQQLVATAHYGDLSTQDVTAWVEWSSSDLSVSVAPGGLARAEEVGIATITATLSGVSGTTTVTANPAVVVSVVVSPGAAAVAKGLDRSFTATALYSDGAELDVTGTADWSSSDATVATVSAGLAHGAGVGSVSVDATVIDPSVGPVVGSATLDVTPAELQSIEVASASPTVAKGLEVQLTATGHYTDGSTADLTGAATWTSDGAVTVDAAGLATGAIVGPATATATSGSVHGDVSLTVTPAALQSIEVTSASPTVAKGLKVQLTATGHYTDGSTADLTGTATWTSDGAVTVDAAGLATGAIVGPATATATSGSLHGDVALTVTPAVLVAVTVQPGSASLVVGQALTFVATGHYSDGTSQPETASWGSDASAVTVDGAGLASAVSVGTAILTATVGAVAGTATVDVSAAPLASIVVAPDTASIAKGLTQQFTATAHYTDLSTKDVTAIALWAATDPAAASVSATGLATGLDVGASSIVASIGAISGAASLTITDRALVSLEVTPAVASVAKGLDRAFTATGHYTDASTADLTATALWVSSDAAIASVSGGVAHGVAEGSVTIDASVDGKLGSAALTVTAPVLESIEVTPPSASIPKGRTQQFVATGHFSDGSTQDLTATVGWGSNAAVATVGAGGLATGVAEGSTAVTATSGPISGGASLTVTAPVLVTVKVYPASGSVAKGATLQFTATGIYSDGPAEVALAGVAWLSSDAAIATIGAATGLAAGVETGLGTATITATKDGVSGTATLAVTAPALTSIEVTPATATIAKGLTQQFAATGHYSDGSTQPLTASVAWAATPAVATVTAGGLATGVGVGSTTVTATVGSISGGATLTVGPAVLTAVTLTPANASVSLGYTQQYAATAVYSDGAKADVTGSATWDTSNHAVATVTAGLVTTVATGGVTVTATLDGVVGAAPLTVTGALLVAINVAPATPSVPLGLTQQFSATGVFSDATKQDLTTQVVWSSSNVAAATITSGGGLATTVAAGTSTITATHGAISGQTLLTVTSATLTAVEVTPLVATMAAGTTLQFTATGVYSDLSTLDVTALATWSASGGAVTVSNLPGSQGLATGVTSGTGQITVAYGGFSDVAAVTVTTAALVSITVSPSTQTLPPGVNYQFTATGHFDDGSTQDLTATASWTTSDATLVSVSNTVGSEGMATTIAPGTATVTATQAAISGMATVTVSNSVLQAITVFPANAQLPAGYKLQYQAVASYSDGATVDVTAQVVWASSNTAVATVSNSVGTEGLVSGLVASATPVTISATLGTTSGSTGLTVVTARIQSISVTPSPFTVAVRGTQQMTAMGTFQGGIVIDITTQCGWATSSRKVATVSKKGLVTGVSAVVNGGAVTITAKEGGKTGSASGTVVP